MALALGWIPWLWCHPLGRSVSQLPSEQTRTNMSAKVCNCSRAGEGEGEGEEGGRGGEGRRGGRGREGGWGGGRGWGGKQSGKVSSDYLPLEEEMWHTRIDGTVCTVCADWRFCVWEKVGCLCFNIRSWPSSMYLGVCKTGRKVIVILYFIKVNCDSETFDSW